VNGRYSLALTTEERLVIAFMAGVASYFADDETGAKMPGTGYLMEYMKPFIERERLEWERNRVHLKLGPAAVQERKLEAMRAELIEVCERRIEGLKK